MRVDPGVPSSHLLLYGLHVNISTPRFAPPKASKSASPLPAPVGLRARLFRVNT